ncbi:MAG: hypothetical protein HKN43_03650 [Rhodothermales bacterium]|nr:hypothetical protein [Rhodothermales bacterium]
MTHYPGSRNDSLVYFCAVSIFIAVSLTGCRSKPSATVQSYLSGTLTVSADADSTGDYSGFEVAVLSANTEDDLDTLGYAITNTDGTFEMALRSDERGIFPVEIRRNDRLLIRDQFALAENDSATIRQEFPMKRSFLMFRSVENGAWMAYRNTRALHNQRLADLSASSSATLDDLRAAVLQASEIMWSLNESYPGTIGAELAMTESIMMLEGWDDSLVTARSYMIEPTDAGFINSVQALRRSTARQFGVAAAVDSLESRLSGISDPEIASAVRAEIVLAHLDSMDVTAARAAAKQLESKSDSDKWDSWATSAMYEMDNLMPGMAAPNANFTDLAGRELDLNFFFDTTVLLEFIDPSDLAAVVNQRARTDLLKLSDGTNLQVITISLNRDRIANEIYLENRTTVEAYIVPRLGVDSEIARAYNVKSVPKRFLIHEGRIFAKYGGTSVAGIRQDILSLLD